MKIIGKSSLATFLKRLVTVALVIEIVILLLMVPAVLLDESGVSYTWPITLDNENVTPKVEANVATANAITIGDAQGGFEFRENKMLAVIDTGLMAKLLRTLHNVVVMGVILVITLYVRKILHSLTLNLPFSNDNSKHVKRMAYALLFLVVFGIIESVLERMHLNHVLALTAANLNYVYLGKLINLQTLLTGLLLLILAEVWRLGNELKIENDSFL